MGINTPSSKEKQDKKYDGNKSAYSSAVDKVRQDTKKKVDKASS